jgi:hypothetical protein
LSEIVADIIDAVEFAVGGPVAPIVNHIVAEIGVDDALKADVAALVVGEEVVMPRHAAPAGEGGIPVSGEVESLAQDAPLHGDPIAELGH